MDQDLGPEFEQKFHPMIVKTLQNFYIFSPGLSHNETHWVKLSGPNVGKPCKRENVWRTPRPPQFIQLVKDLQKIGGKTLPVVQIGMSYGAYCGTVSRRINPKLFAFSLLVGGYPGANKGQKNEWPSHGQQLALNGTPGLWVQGDAGDKGVKADYDGFLNEMKEFSGANIEHMQKVILRANHEVQWAAHQRGAWGCEQPGVRGADWFGASSGNDGLRTA
jgi:hypothetical protein